MDAQIDPQALKGIVDEVRELARRAEPSVRENQRTILIDEGAERDRSYDLHVRSAGVWAIAQRHNQPFAASLATVTQLVDAVMAAPEDRRERELSLIYEAVSCPASRASQGSVVANRIPRAFWFVRVLALATALRLQQDPACGAGARRIVDQAVRDHLLGFADDPIARAAHRFERVLVPYVLRLLLGSPGINFTEQARRLTAVLDDEERLRTSVDADQLLISATCEMVRRHWFGFSPWTHEALDEIAQALEQLLPSLECSRDSAMGPAHDPFLDRWITVDPLVEVSLTILNGAGPLSLDPDVIESLQAMAQSRDAMVA